MRLLHAAAIALIASCLLASCSDPEERADVGYDDGYAVGYNTECRIRATLVDGDFGNEHYATAYERGYRDGKDACRNRDE